MCIRDRGSVVAFVKGDDHAVVEGVHRHNEHDRADKIHNGVDNDIFWRLFDLGCFVVDICSFAIRHFVPPPFLK